MSQPPKKLLDLLSEQIQLKHYSPRTEESYVRRVIEFILFQKAETGSFHHPGEMGMSEVNQFLTYLAVDRKVAASTQSHALLTAGSNPARSTPCMRAWYPRK